MNKKWNLEITSMSLHMMAMAFMLCDHLWGTIVSGNDWLTCIGRLAYPIFAFMIVEGYFHTGNLKKYVLRMTLFAVISEIPFNLMMGSSIVYPFHQNVMWTFLISMGLIWLNEKAKGKPWREVLTGAGTILLGYVLGMLLMVDYYGPGVLTVLVFYFFCQRKWWSYMGQLLCLAYINMEMLGGFTYEFTILGHTFSIARQAFALLALIPIWLYHGKQGAHNKALRCIYYAFYPLHLLILGLLQMYL